MSIFKQLFGRADAIDLTEEIKQGAFLVDVRTPAEFANNKVRGSVNIPLDQIMPQLSKFLDKKTVIVFCKSGGRSLMATSILKKNGVNVINGKTYQHVQKFIQ